MSPSAIGRALVRHPGRRAHRVSIGLTLQSREGCNNLGMYGGQFFPLESEFDQLLQLMGMLPASKPGLTARREGTE
jgi:hypothetical protein